VAQFIPDAMAAKKTAGDELDHGPSIRKETAGEAGFFGIGPEMLAPD
jgi:hypothetical protein